MRRGGITASMVVAIPFDRAVPKTHPLQSPLSLLSLANRVIDGEGVLVCVWGRGEALQRVRGMYSCWKAIGEEEYALAGVLGQTYW